jgi:uncharacterized protein (TIGR03435 family)
MRRAVCAGVAIALCTTVLAVCARTPRPVAASITPCGGEGRGRYGGPGPVPVAGVLTLQCVTVKELILEAYSSRDPSPAMRPHVEGGPAWIRSDRYTITATAEGKPVLGRVRGAMLRRLLEDRFDLRVHHETRELAPSRILVIDAVSRPSGH